MDYWEQLEIERSKNNKLYGMNYNILKSRTFWTSVLLFLFNGFSAISGSVPATYSVPINFVLGSLVAYFHLAGVQAAAGQ